MKKLRSLLKEKKLKFNRKTVFMFFGLFFCFVIVFLGNRSLARYVYDTVKDYYLESKSFYFNCDKMTEDGAVFQIDNWAGTSDFTVLFNMDSLKNNYVASDSDINYYITYTKSSNIDLVISKTTGFISSVDNTDYFSVTISPNTALGVGDSVWFEVHAKSTAPYEKELSGRFTLNVSLPGLDYKIEDEEYDTYFNFRVTNTLDSYTIREAFDSYSVGDRISIADYLALTDAKKAKCSSVRITLDFNPRQVLVDLTSNFYSGVVSTQSTLINGKSYINQVVFDMDAIDSETIRFYKVNASQNYTYPITNPTSIVSFSANY